MIVRFDENVLLQGTASAAERCGSDATEGHDSTEHSWRDGTGTTGVQRTTTVLTMYRLIIQTRMWVCKKKLLYRGKRNPCICEKLGQQLFKKNSKKVEII